MRAGFFAAEGQVEAQHRHQGKKHFYGGSSEASISPNADIIDNVKNTSKHVAEADNGKIIRGEAYGIDDGSDARQKAGGSVIKSDI